MINTTAKTTQKLLILLGTVIAGFGLLFVSRSIMQKHSSNTITLDGNTVESMVFLQTSDASTQLLPWNPTDGYQSVYNFYDNELKKHEDALWCEAEQSLGIKREDFQQQLKLQSYNFSNKKAKRSGKLSSETLSMVEAIIKECGIDPCTVEIVGDTRKTASPAMATHKTIYINEELFKEFSPESVHFIIAHETMHIKNQDGMAHGILDFMLEKKGTPVEQQKKFVNNFLRLQETRADVQAVLTHQKFAQGGSVFFDELMKMSASGTKRHPKDSDRLTLCQTVTGMWNTLNNGVQHA